MSILLPHHAGMLAKSAIEGAVARGRGYFSATKRTELARLGFAPYQQNVPALVVPIHDVNGEIRNYQSRPDVPRIDSERGRSIKYETVANSRVSLDVPPSARAQLANPEIELWITEGVKKGDALVSAGLCAVALLGVWNWRGTNDKGGKTVLPDWDSIALNDRRVFLAFDSEAMTKRGVHQALGRLAGFLESRGAVVRFVLLPDPGNGKCGADDFLAAGGTVPQLRELAQPDLPEIPPKPEPVRAAPRPTAELLAAVERLLLRYVRFAGEHEPTALALYALHTWAVEAARVTPYILISSPTKRSGKTRLLEVVELVAREPLRAASVTEAALFQAVEAFRPTLLIDEVDAIFSGRSERAEALRGVLNAGNARGSYVVRGTQDGTPVKFSVFGPKVLAGIANGKLPDTIRDRSIVMQMERKLRSDVIERMRAADLEVGVAEIRERLDDWSHAHVAELGEYRCETLPAVSDRLEEAWEPLLAIAEIAGGDWPARARAAVAGLAGGTDELDGQDAGVILLGALREMFGDEHALASKVVCEKLNANDELPFGAMRGGQGIDPRGVGKLLRPYGVKPRVVRVGQDTPRGYHRDQLAEPWERYLDGGDTRAADPTPEPQQAQQAQHPAPHAACDVADVADVADEMQALSLAGVNGNGTAPRLGDDHLTERERELADLYRRQMGSAV